MASIPTYQNPNQQIYQTLGSAPTPYTPGNQTDAGYMYSSQMSTKAAPGYRSVSLINPQATEIQRGHIGVQTNGDILVQVDDRSELILFQFRGYDRSVTGSCI